MLTVLYLAAVVAANLSVAHWGKPATIPVAFLLIGFDLVSRDRLHDEWGEHGRLGLLWRMGLLILAGGALTYGINADAGRIAVASTVAFAAAALTDLAVYGALHRRHRLVRSNGSNVPAAAVDSVLFPVLAFGGFPFLIIAGQFAAKTLGGLLWSVLLYRRRRAVPARHA